MAFGPDIIVTEPEGWQPALVIEAETTLCDLGTLERKLKNYMSGTGCPTGLIVSPQQLRLYRNRYESTSQDPIELVGTFDVHDVLHYRPPGDGGDDAFEFEGFVQEWIEGLGTESGLQELPAQLRRAVEWYILPAVSQGDVRAAHPRPPTSLRAYST